MADEEDKSQKTEDPTLHKLEKAREDGDIALSRELYHFMLIATFALLILYTLPKSFRQVIPVLSFFLENASQVSLENIGSVLQEQVIVLMKIWGVPLCFLALAGLLSGVAQTRFLVSTKKLAPKLSKLSPREGLKRIFGMQNVVELFKHIFKITVISWITYVLMRPEFSRFYTLVPLTPSDLMSEMAFQISSFFGIVAVVLGVIALFDYGYQRFSMMQKLKMSRQEIKEEFKEMEGDPHVKAKQKSKREALARQRIAQAIPTATVVITNPTHFAIALKYEMGDSGAPEVVAKGKDLLALRMRELAKEHDVPIVENPPLARALYKDLEVGDQIPTKYYHIVAKIIRYVMGLEKTAPSDIED